MMPAATPEAITAARSVLWGVDGGAPPYMARIREYVSIESTGPERDAEMDRWRAAEAEAEDLNNDLVRRALEAAEPFMVRQRAAAEPSPSGAPGDLSHA